MRETISRLPLGLLLGLLLLGIMLFGATVTHSQEVAAQIGPSKAPIPGNDDLVNATVVPSLPYNDAISYVAPESATGEPDEAICGNQQGGVGFTASAWYKYTAAQSGVLNVTITPNETTDVSLAIYTGPADSPTHPLTDNLGCRDVAGAGQAENLAAGVSAGTTYYVRMATLGDSGDYRVDMIDSVSVFLPLVIKSPPSSSWQAQDSTIEVDLYAIDCPTTTFCVAVGVNGGILTTTDGGTTWDKQQSGIAFSLNDVSCRDANNCVTVGDAGLILRTSDGGSNWFTEDSRTSQILRGVGCATDTCFAVGGDNNTSTGVVSFDGGDEWVIPPKSLGNTDLYGASCPNDGTCTVVGRFGRVLVFAGTGVKDGPFNLGTDLRDVDCATDSFCLTVGVAGEIQKTDNGGSSWTPRASGTAQPLEGVSCPDAQTCYAAGDGGTVITSANGGENWEPESTNLTTNLNDVSCPDSTTCYAVGAGGTILGKK